MDAKNIKTQIHLEEYKSLRDETVKRVELSFQIINLTLLATGALWTLGTTETDIVLLLHPWLVFCFAAIYGANNFLIVELGVYTGEVIEKKVHELCWASYFSRKVWLGRLISSISLFGIFAGTSVISLVIFTVKASNKQGIPQWLFTAGIVATIFTIFILLFTLFYKPKNVAKVVEKIMQKKVSR